MIADRARRRSRGAHPDRQRPARALQVGQHPDVRRALKALPGSVRASPGSGASATRSWPRDRRPPPASRDLPARSRLSRDPSAGHWSIYDAAEEVNAASSTSWIDWDAHALRSRPSALVGCSGPRRISVSDWQPSQRYPTAGPRGRPELRALQAEPRQGGAARHGIPWSEGPVWFGDARCLILSDIPNNRMMPGTGTGMTPSTASRRLRQRATPATVRGAWYVRARRPPRAPDGVRRHDHHDRRPLRRRRLNSPNDVACKSDGSICSPIRRLASSATTRATRPSRSLPGQVFARGVTAS